MYGCDLAVMLFKWTVILSIAYSQVYSYFWEKILFSLCYAVVLSFSQLKLLAAVSCYWQLKMRARISPHLCLGLCSCGQMNNFRSWLNAIYQRHLRTRNESGTSPKTCVATLFNIIRFEETFYKSSYGSSNVLSCT